MDGTIFNIQHFSTQDGPGIRTTVFLKGCPLHCVWCHNPESQHAYPERIFDAKLCIHCGSCAAACPSQAITITDGLPTVDPTACRLCGACTDVCPTEAMRRCGNNATVDDVMANVLRDALFYKNSGGGLTISGGEPLFQPAFTLALAKEAKRNNVHVCIETCGYGDEAALRELAAYTDLFLFDIKLLDAAQHKTYTGVDNAVIMQNLEVLNALGAPVILRCPLIPNVNLNEAHFRGIAAIAERLPCVKEVHLLPYHPLGLEKLKQLGREAVYTNDRFLSAEEIHPYVEMLQSQTHKPVHVL